MKTFKEYTEQENLVDKIIMTLYYSEDLSPEQVANMNINQISNLIIKNNLTNPSIDLQRLSAMVKLKTRIEISGNKLHPNIDNE